MKIKNITDVGKFFEVVGTCKGRVELVSSEGDRLNLKSKLSQYVALSQLFADARIDDVEIIFSEPEDVAKMVDFLVRS